MEAGQSRTSNMHIQYNSTLFSETVSNKSLMAGKRSWY